MLHISNVFFPQLHVDTFSWVTAWNLCMARSRVFQTPSSLACLSRWPGRRSVLAISLRSPTFVIFIQEPFGVSPQSALEGAKLLIKAVNSVQLPLHHEWALANPQLDTETGSDYMDRILQYEPCYLFHSFANFLLKIRSYRAALTLYQRCIESNVKVGRIHHFALDCVLERDMFFDPAKFASRKNLP